jgi:metal-responsive CopG/Arc/MetJ family transcriptional regulator
MTEQKTVAIRVELPNNLRNEFKSVVAREGKNMRDVLVDFIEDYVKKRSIQSKNDYLVK